MTHHCAISDTLYCRLPFSLVIQYVITYILQILDLLYYIYDKKDVILCLYSPHGPF